jgi:hypothetical protein
LEGFCETAFFWVFAAARTADFFTDFFVDFLAAFAPLFRLMTVFFAISRPVAVAATFKDAGAASRDGRGLLWEPVRAKASRLIFCQRPQ